MLQNNPQTPNHQDSDVPAKTTTQRCPVTEIWHYYLQLIAKTEMKEEAWEVVCCFIIIPCRVTLPCQGV